MDESPLLRPLVSLKRNYEGLCERCAQALSPSASQHPYASTDYERSLSNYGWLLYRSWPELARSAEECRLCDRVAAELQRHKRWNHPAKPHSVRFRIDRIDYLSDGSRRTLVTGPITWQDGEDKEPNEGPHLTAVYKQECIHSKDNVSAIADEATSGSASRAWSSVTSIDIESRLRTAKQWFDHCSRNHAECGVNPLRQLPVTLPTRLIDLGLEDDMQPRLVRGESIKDMTTRYTTISHRWSNGAHAPLCSYIENLQDFEWEIPTKRLSQTFQDAMRITRLIGIRYMWIDSLCIVQNSEQEWEVEASRMGGVYQGSELNITAIDSESPQGGCFLQNMAGALHFCSHAVPRSACITVRLPCAHSSYVQHSELASRGWVMQELLLPNRTLHASKDQFLWECKEQVNSEDGMIRGLRGPLGIHQLRSWQTDHVSWELLIARYSQLSFTFKKDRLPALAGIFTWRTQLPTRGGDSYILGWWSENTGRALSWATSIPRDEMDKKLPSWTWLAAGAPVEYDVCDRPDDELDAVEIRTYGERWSGLPTASELIDVTFVVRAILVTIECVVDDRHDLVRSRYYRGRTKYSGLPEVTAEIKLDSSEIIDKSCRSATKSFTAMLTTAVLPRSPENAWFINTRYIILQPADNVLDSTALTEQPSAYKRIGYGHGYVHWDPQEYDGLTRDALAKLHGSQLTELRLV